MELKTCILYQESFSILHSQFSIPFMPPLHLFLGENAYALREEKRRWIEEFVKKHGEENLIRMAGKGTQLRELLDVVSVLPFIAQRRLVVIEGIPNLSKEQFQLLAEHIHPQTVVLIVDSKIDRRLAGSKELLALATVKQFPPLLGKPLLSWMQSFVREQGSALEPAASAMLLEHLGEDQDMLSEELRKLALFSSGRTITVHDVEQLTFPSFEGIVWKLTDLLAAGRRSDALLYAHRYTARGGDAYGLWAILLSMLKNLVAVAAARREGSTNAQAIAADLDIPFFAVRSLLPAAARMGGGPLRTFLAEAVDADIALKTGAHRATDEAPEEILALIDHFILTMPG